MSWIPLRALSPLALALLLPFQPASAAVLTTSTNAILTDADGNTVVFDPDQVYIPDTTTGGRTASACSRIDERGGVMNGAGDGDVRTGSFTSSASKNDIPNLGEGGAGTYATFVAQGSGAVAFRFDLSGGWDVRAAPPLDDVNRFYQEALMQFTSSAGTIDRQQIIDSACDADFKPPDFDPTGRTSQAPTCCWSVASAASVSSDPAPPDEIDRPGGLRHKGGFLRDQREIRP